MHAEATTRRIGFAPQLAKISSFEETAALRLLAGCGTAMRERESWNSAMVS